MASTGIVHRAIGKVIRQLQFRGVKSMRFAFDPYGSNTASIRYSLFQLHAPKLLQTNPNLNMKVDVKSDRSDPLISVAFVDGDILNLKTGNLSNLEILSHLKHFCDIKDPKQHEPVSMALTKITKKKR